ncbi:MAG TPA: DUF167 domain-containing protein [Burkholderiaceae bacterium]|nr:DUF167 domain-containing protein [Burkholderiaceae bacterium]
MISVRIKVKPNARKESLTCQSDGSWIAQIKAPPIDGLANAALIALVAQHWGVRKTQVSIKSGSNGRWKLLMIKD